MKKTLFGTSALIAASVAMAGSANAQGIELGVGGYMNNFFGFGSVEDDTNAAPFTDNGDYNSTGHFSDGEIHFTGETTLDNGITVGAQVQLESFSSGDQIDENYAYVEGSFGRVLLGSENTAAYLMQYGAPNVGVPINSGWITPFVAPAVGFNGGIFRHPSGSTYGDFGNDENGVSYYTPRFSGFQVGVTYTPTLNNSGDGANFPTNAVQNAGAGDGNHGVSVGANFVRSFNGFDIALAGGYRTVMDENQTIYGDSPEMYSAGLNVGFGGFTVGGSWLMQDSETPGGADSNDDGNSFDLGASYTTGPWSVGITGLYSETEGNAAAGDQELTSVEGGVEYALGPGVTTSFSILYANWEADTGNESDGLLGIAGLALSF